MQQAEALRILQTGASAFLTGAPGSGKTFVANQYVRWLRSRGVKPALTASTGIAATHLNGMTIHTWAGIRIAEALTEAEVASIAADKRVAKRIRQAEVLIIDEISMLSGHVLGLVERVCRAVKRLALPFGGIQVVLVGDFFQLPPVGRRNLAEASAAPVLLPDDAPTSLFAFAHPVWRQLAPVVLYLTEQHRQADLPFLGLLDAVRQNRFGEEHRQLLRGRYSKLGPPDSSKLFSHNADVDRVNRSYLDAVEGPATQFAMGDEGPSDYVLALRRGCLSPELLELKRGARVMFTYNHAEGQYVNGSLGVVESLQGGDGYPLVRLDNGRLVSALPATWTMEDYLGKTAQIVQVPLRLAWAITIHKCQGMTLEKVHMDLSQTFEYGQGYVALSRARTLAGMTLAGLNARATEVHPEVVAFDATLLESAAETQQAFAQLAAEDWQERCDRHLKKALSVAAVPSAPGKPSQAAKTRAGKRRPGG